MAKKKSLIDGYQDHLVGQGKSPNTIKAYGRDVSAFALWWQLTYGQTFNPQAVTSPVDL
jgi:site-specific recombinase XerD